MPASYLSSTFLISLTLKVSPEVPYTTILKIFVVSSSFWLLSTKMACVQVRNQSVDSVLSR
jgi:hypothetical protein